MLNVLVLAVGAAVSPTILAVVIVVLHRPRPRRLLAAYLVGGLLTSVAVGIAIVTSLNELEVVSGSSPAADPIVNFTIGFLSLLVAYVLATDRGAGFSERRREKKAAKPQRDPWSERVLSRGSGADRLRRRRRPRTCPAPSTSSRSRTSPRRRADSPTRSSRS